MRTIYGRTIPQTRMLMLLWLPEPLRDYLEYWGASRLIPPVHKLIRKRLANIVAHAAETFDHSDWDAVLKTHVTTGGTLIDGQQIIEDVSLWFANDFGGFRGAAEHAVAAARTDADPRCLPVQPDVRRASLRYFRYSWLLNAKKPEKPLTPV